MGSHAATGRRPARRMLAALAIVPAVAFSLSCSDTNDLKSRSLCTVFERVVENRVKVAALDVSQANAEEATKLVEEHQVLVDQLQQASDGRYASAIEQLATALADLHSTLASAPADADYATWAPLVEDSLKDVRTASDQLESVIEPSCAQPDTTNT